MLAMTEIRKDISISKQDTPFPYQYRGGNRKDYNIFQKNRLRKLKNNVNNKYKILSKYF